MNNWRRMELGKAIRFNPSESIKKGSIAKKIAMEKLTPFEKKISGFELSVFSSAPKFRNGDTLVAKITPCLENGKTAQVDILENNEIGFGSTEFIVLRENENSINDFIFYLAKSPAFRRKAISCMEGTSGRKRVNEGALKLQELLIPDISTQQRIASVLSALDAKIELNNRINAELEAMAKTLYDYWFVQFDFPDANGKPYKSSGGKMIWNNELKRELPDGWEVKELGRICNIYQPKTISEKEMIENGEYLVFGANGIVGRYDKFNHSESEIAVCCRGASCGNILRTQPKSWITGNAMVFHSIHEKICSELIYQMLNYLDMKKSVTGSAQPQITRTNVFSLKVLVPDDKSLTAFDKFSNPIVEKQISFFNENQKLAELRDWLLPMLMNGQVTVGGEE